METNHLPNWAREIAEQIKDMPKLRSDWKNSNHYELQNLDNAPYFWLTIPDLFIGEYEDWQSTEAGKRLGLIMDAAVMVPALLQALNKAYEVIEKAPHGDECESWCCYKVKPCNCWKLEALSFNPLEVNK